MSRKSSSSRLKSGSTKTNNESSIHIDKAYSLSASSRAPIELGSVSNFEKILNDEQIRLKMIYLRHAANKSGHEVNVDLLRSRARELLETEISNITNKLDYLQGPNNQHRITALSQISASLCGDLEEAIFTEAKEDLMESRNEQKRIIFEASKEQAELRQELAVQKQIIEDLISKNNDLEAVHRSVARTNAALQRELELAARCQADINQFCVELRMQGLDYKAESDRRCQKILASVQSKMGFVPVGIQKQVMHLKVLKCPGDPSYELARNRSKAKGKAKKKPVMPNPSPGERTDPSDTSSDREEEIPTQSLSRANGGTKDNFIFNPNGGSGSSGKNSGRSGRASSAPRSSGMESNSAAKTSFDDVMLPLHTSSLLTSSSSPALSSGTDRRPTPTILNLTRSFSFTEPSAGKTLKTDAYPMTRQSLNLSVSNHGTGSGKQATQPVQPPTPSLTSSSSPRLTHPMGSQRDTEKSRETIESARASRTYRPNSPSLSPRNAATRRVVDSESFRAESPAVEESHSLPASKTNGIPVNPPLSDVDFLFSRLPDNKITSNDHADRPTDGLSDCSVTTTGGVIAETNEVSDVSPKRPLQTQNDWVRWAYNPGVATGMSGLAVSALEAQSLDEYADEAELLHKVEDMNLIREINLPTPEAEPGSRSRQSSTYEEQRRQSPSTSTSRGSSRHTSLSSRHSSVTSSSADVPGLIRNRSTSDNSPASPRTSSRREVNDEANRSHQRQPFPSHNSNPADNGSTNNNSRHSSIQEDESLRSLVATQLIPSSGSTPSSPSLMRRRSRSHSGSTASELQA